jgi:hypothetical protein
MNDFIQPLIKSKKFHCPNCAVLAEQTWSSNISWGYVRKLPNGNANTEHFKLVNTMIAKCNHCVDVSYWSGEKMIFPYHGNVEKPNSDLPEDIQNDYNEAKNIVNTSPRGSAALLRLCIQKLCIHLGEKGKNINEDIKNLVKKGLPETMQQALDSARVIGNNAVHPGKIDLNDKVEVAYALFGFTNIICEVLISQPKKIKEFYEKTLPTEAISGIQNRDKK